MAVVAGPQNVYTMFAMSAMLFVDVLPVDVIQF
jgi:hypothetical protein